jgi:hypothetical protein
MLFPLMQSSHKVVNSCGLIAARGVGRDQSEVHNLPIVPII